MNETYLVPDCNLSTLLARIEKLNRRARKLGVSEVSVSHVVDHVRPRFQIADSESVWADAEQAKKLDAWIAEGRSKAVRTGEVMPWHAVTVVGEVVKMNGWEFIASLEPVETEDGIECVILTAPGKECPTEFKDSYGDCDHCKKQRNRKQTFVLRHESGEYKVIGRQCIRDFLGHMSPQEMASRAEWLFELGSVGEASECEEWLGGGGGSPAIDLAKLLSYVAAAMRVDGWVSRSAAEDRNVMATCDRVDIALCGRGKMADELKKAYAPEEGDEKLAEQAIEWARSMESPENTYLQNLQVVAKAGYVMPKTLGISASMISAYQRAMGIEREAGRTVKVEYQHIGSPKKREQFEVVVDRVITSEGYYGVTYITIMHVEVSETVHAPITWFASSSHDLEEGGRYLVKATVKSHGEYNGKPQTLVSRVSLVEELASVE